MLHVELRDQDIFVTLPGTTYKVAYYKHANSPQLLAKFYRTMGGKLFYPGKDVPSPLMTQAEFHARAWKAAHDTARELGWIV
jgi:hypothetical protein